ncbi:PAS domain S-box protein [Fertoebacter nigrum]|uniref:histidine kinase n=1 Tax=Fertoeibacter niger TaxID=2656921 RepID=A0A8X8KPU5_9RHOB|nr:ATP-binding protein [Fertoeibacter niger]NUB46460.1 PAS domain S-box protein [Fertoeibacter niger]
MRWLRSAMVVLIVLAFVAIVVLAAQLRGELRLLQEEPVDSLHWNVTQLELDVVRLEAAATLAQAVPMADLADLRKRFDLFYSRADTVTKGTMFLRLGLSETVTPLKSRMQAFLDDTAALIDGDEAALRAALPEVEDALGALRLDLRAAVIQVIDVNAALQDARRAKLSDVVQMIALASVALIALLLGLLGMVVTLNRQAGRRAREVQRITSRLAATVGTSLDAVVVAGMDGRVIEFNAAAETIFGYARAEAIGQPLANLIIPPHHRAAHDAGMERMKTTGVRHVVDAGRIRITAMRKSGEEFPVELSIASNDSPEGMIFIAYLRDISDARRAEAALVAARDEAQAAERTKTSFIAVMSHEMRTPLNGVIGALEVLGRTPLEPKQERFLTLARTSAKQLLRHVNDVLDISRVDAGHAGLLDDRFDMPALVATLVDPLRPVAGQKNNRIDVRLLGDFPPLQGDPFRIGQILQNFISNAIKFTEDGSITVEAEVQRMNGSQVEVELRVTDTGIGIAEPDQDRIFEDFVMVDPSYGRSVGGTGLGLAISRRLARAMGGEVGVESAEGEGSCFWLRLPLRSAADPTVVAVSDATPHQSQASPALDVLVVEDNETNRIVLEEMLHHLGHRVTLAVDGGDGVEKARARRFDVILMDLSMPLMDGWTAATAIRLLGASQHSRILAVTAHARPDQTDRLEEAGLDGWLTKPLSTASLTEALTRDHAAGASPATDHPLETFLDAERLDDLRRIANQAGLHRILQKFRTDIERTLATIDVDGETASPADLAAVAHAGVGAAAVVGASRLSRELASLEAACLVGDATAMKAHRAGLPAIWLGTLAALDTEIGAASVNGSDGTATGRG